MAADTSKLAPWETGINLSCCSSMTVRGGIDLLLRNISQYQNGSYRENTVFHILNEGKYNAESCYIAWLHCNTANFLWNQRTALSSPKKPVTGVVSKCKCDPCLTFEIDRLYSIRMRYRMSSVSFCVIVVWGWCYFTLDYTMSLTVLLVKQYIQRKEFIP